MKENFTRFCFAFLFVLLCSCAVDPTGDIVYSSDPSQELLDSYLTLDELSEGFASVTYEEGTDVVKVYSDRKWTITSPTSWFTLKTYQGYKYTDINIQQEQNPYNFVRRGELIITVTATDNEPEIVYNIMVKQMGDPDAGDANLSSPYIEFTSSNVDNDIQWETISGANYYRVMVSKDETFADDQIVANHLIESSTEEYYTYDLADVEYLSTSGHTMVDNRTGETFTANAYVDGETYVRVDAVIYVDMDDDGIDDLYAVPGENYLKRDQLFGGGSGTEADPFLISTPNHFRNIKLITNPGTDYSVYNTPNPIVGYFKQTADLDFSEGGFFPVGTYESNSSVISSTQHIFQGCYDAGKSSGFSNGNESERWGVKNVKYYNSDNTNVGLFAHVGYKGSVTNIDVDNIDLQGKTNVGSIVGNNGGTIKYCKALNGTIASIPAAISGGIVGNMYNGRVEGCDNYMTGLSDGATIGGIVAMIALKEGVTMVGELPRVYIEDCQNHGAFVGGSSMANMGGIVGASSCTVANAPTLTSNPTGVDDERYINVYRCVNYAYLTALNAGNKSNIAGIFAKQANIGAHIYQCGNVGDIYFPELSGAGCAGICAYTSTYITDGFVHQFEECYNTGDIKSLASLAGAAGICCRNEKVHSVFTNCYNQGKIEQCYDLANNSTEGAMSFTNNQTAGGIAAYISNLMDANRSFTMENCYNSGPIYAEQTYDDMMMAGGLLGFIANNAVVSAIIRWGGCYSLEDQGDGYVYSQDARMQWAVFNASKVLDFYKLSVSSITGNESDMSAKINEGVANVHPYQSGVGSDIYKFNTAYYNKSISEMKSGSTYKQEDGSSWPTTIWSLTDGDYPTLQWEKGVVARTL